MEKIITFENLENFAYSNCGICTQPIQGIVLSFFGLGCQDMYWEETEEGKYFAQKGILYVVPYNNPWAWMNPQSVAYTDEILEVLRQQYALPQDIPVVSTGGSMGGQAALTYMVYASHTPVACIANCPVCDLPYHFTERKDLPRTLYSAFFWEIGTMKQALEAASPFHLTEKMPKAQYVIFHCEKDMAVNKEKHSDRFVAQLQLLQEVHYYAVPERGHCDLTPELWNLYKEWAVKAIKGCEKK